MSGAAGEEEEVALVSSQVDIIPARKEHLDAIVAYHRAAFPEDVITRLGPRFLRGMYDFYVGRSDGICLVAIKRNTNTLLGVVLGGCHRLLRRYVLKTLPSSAIVMLLAAARDSCVRRHLTSILTSEIKHIYARLHIWSPSRVQRCKPNESQERWYLLRSLTVCPGVRRQGVASALLEEFRIETARRGIGTMRLISANDNIAAHCLYEKLGWAVVETDGVVIHFRRSV